MGTRIQSACFTCHGIDIRLCAGLTYLEAKAARLLKGRRPRTGGGTSFRTKPARRLGSPPGARFAHRRGFDDEEFRTPAGIRPGLPDRSHSDVENRAAPGPLLSKPAGGCLLHPASR